MDFKVKTIESDREEDRMLNELAVSPVREKYVEIGDEKFVLPIYFNEYWERVNKFEVRDDDVYICGHMKTGTTWLHEIVDLIVNGVKSKDTNITRLFRHLFLDWSVIYNTKIPVPELPELADDIGFMNAIKTQRCIRSHLPWPFLPEQIRNGTKTPKMIHIRRNPKDTCISFYHHSRAMDGFRGNFEQFCKLFLAGRMIYGPFAANVKSFWEQRNRSNIFFVTYSDLKKDLPGMIKKIATFLEKPLTEEEVQELVEYVSVDSMKKHMGKEMEDFKMMFATMHNNCVQQCDFVREGKEGGYKSVMSEKVMQEFDKYEKEAFSGTDLSF